MADPTVSDVFDYYPQLKSLCDSHDLIQLRLNEAIAAIPESVYGALAFQQRIDYAVLRLHETGCVTVFGTKEEHKAAREAFDLSRSGASSMFVLDC